MFTRPAGIFRVSPGRWTGGCFISAGGLQPGMVGVYRRGMTRPPLPLRTTLRVQLALLLCALLLCLWPPTRAASLWLVPVALGQMQVRHMLDVTPRELRTLVTLYPLMLGLIIAVSGSRSGLGLWAVGLGVVIGLALLLLERHLQRSRATVSFLSKN